MADVTLLPPLPIPPEPLLNNHHSNNLASRSKTLPNVFPLNINHTSNLALQLLE